MAKYAEEAQHLIGTYTATIKKYPRIEEFLRTLADGDTIRSMTDGKIQILLDEMHHLFPEPINNRDKLKKLSAECSEALSSNVVRLPTRLRTAT